MLKQYFDIKKAHEECILFFRMGDFYEMFGQDAITASEILDITLTARNKGKETEIEMCGIPHHAANGYISKLTQAGQKVAICEQISDPSVPGLVERDVVRIITPGTTLDDQVLDGAKNNFLCSIITDKKEYGIACIDVSTGEFYVTSIKNKEDVLEVIESFAPQEILVEKIGEITFLEKYASIFGEYVLEGYEDPYTILTEHFNIKNLEGFGLEKKTLMQQAAATVLGYVRHTQKTALAHIHTIKEYNHSQYMSIDGATIRNLDILYNSYTHEASHSLLGVMDHTRTAMGGRLLRTWLVHPLLDVKKINQRLGYVEYFVEKESIRDDIRALLKQMSDIERILARIGCGRAHPRDCLKLADTVSLIPQIKQLLGNSTSFIQERVTLLNECTDIVSYILSHIAEDPPVHLTDGGYIKDGCSEELDELRSMQRNGKEFIAQLQAREREQTGISTLKVKYNKVFGYYIEISKSKSEEVPATYVRKQTLVNAERFITPELKEYEEKIITAQDKIAQLESRLFIEVVEKILPHIQDFQKNAQIIAELDVLSTFGFIAHQYHYCRPELVDTVDITIEAGRHPVIEHSDKIDNYIPNDTIFNQKDHQLTLLTGPNMAGKSSYLRQVALICLMAQIGSFVPAKKASIGIVDRIFTRVGASDNLAEGQSTFMVEMQEASYILHNATDKSLVILDEIGRGTSTYDGMSIAWAIVQYIYTTIKARTLFATHYHELIDMIDNLEKAQNYALAVKETSDGVLFLHKVIKGGINRSYGIEVAKIAGMPSAVINSARTFLHDLEHNHTTTQQQSLFSFNESTVIEEHSTSHSEVIDELNALDLTSLTPMDAFDVLRSYKEKIDNEG